MILQEEYNLNLESQLSKKYVKVSQYDTGRRLLITLLKNDCSMFKIPSEASASINGLKPDGKGFRYDCSIENNKVVVDMKEQMTVLAGYVKCEILLSKGGERIATANFMLSVEESPLSENTPISSTDIPLLQKAIEASETVLSVEKTVKGYSESASKSSQSAQKSAESASSASASSAESARNSSQSAQASAESANNASQSATNAQESAESASNSAREAKTSADSAIQTKAEVEQLKQETVEQTKTLTDSAKQEISTVKDATVSEVTQFKTDTISDITSIKERMVEEVTVIKDDAKAEADKAKESETNAKLSETNASNSAKEAKASADSVANVVSDVSQLKEDIYNQVEKTLSNNEFDWQSGWYEPDGSVKTHAIFKHSKVFKTVQGSTITFKNLRAPANYIACIACFSGDKYMHDVSLKGDSYTDFSSGTFTVPDNVDGVSFISYVDGANEITAKLTTVEVKSDSHEEKIENIENNIQRMESDITENYNQIYNIKKYTIADGIDIKGYYDKNGKLQPADNISTTGILTVPYGVKSIEYTAFRNLDIPTILFLSADMKVAGMVIATTAPVYGDTMYSGKAEIPSDAVYMEFSVVNTNNDSSITVIFSNIESNQKRIDILEKDPLYGMKISCTGNSITSAINSVPGHGYVEQIADAHGITVDNHAIWGAIIPQGHPRANDDVTDIGCIHDTLDSMDADADIVIMSGSINDCEYYSDASFLGEITGDFSSELDSTTFYGALEDMCKKALQKWAGKPIIYVIEHRMTLDNTTYGQYYLKLHEAIVKVMNKWGISIVDLFNDCPSLNCNEGYKAKYTVGDGTHPNYEGYERFYVPRVYAEIKKLLGI